MWTNDYRRVLRLVAEKLDSADIEYMVSGSTALGFYGRPRMTRDIDIVVELAAVHVPQLEFLFSSEFSVDAEEIREAIARRSMFNRVHLQKKDVRGLFEPQPAMDRAYLERWARELGVEALLEEVNRA